MYDTITSRLDMKRNFITRYFQFLFISFSIPKKQQKKEGKEKSFSTQLQNAEERKNNIIGLGQVLNASESFQIKKKFFVFFAHKFSNRSVLLYAHNNKI